MLLPFHDMMRDERGQSTLEYALILSFIAMVAIVGLSALGGRTTNTLVAPAASALP